MRRALVLGREKFKRAKNDENPANCCFRCGKKLRAVYKSKFRPPVGDEKARGVPYVEEVQGLLGFGSNANNFFCTQTCGFRWAIHTARRLPKTKVTAD